MNYRDFCKFIKLESEFDDQIARAIPFQQPLIRPCQKLLPSSIEILFKEHPHLPKLLCELVESWRILDLE